MSFLSKLFGGDATKKAAKANARDLGALRERGEGYIDAGDEAAMGYLDDVPGLYEPYAESGVAAREMLDGGLGLGGAEGSARFLETLRGTPGYQFNQDAAAQAGTRAASAGGRLASGNTMIALQDRAQQIADGTAGSFMDRLYQTTGQGLQAAGGIAGGRTNQAQQVNTTLGNRLGFDSSVTAGLNNNRNNAASAQEQGVANMWDVGTKFLGFLAG